jgi:pimeloyl-ACP methyl ester carboxylesterase
MPREKLNDVEIFYERSGSGPPLVLVHGSWGDHHNWDPVVPALAREFSVVRYDRRGHSQSGPAPMPGSVSQDVDDLLLLIERLGLGQPVVIGNSFGAIVTLRAIARAPTAFRAIVVHEPPLTAMVANDPATRGMIAETTRHFWEDIVALLDAGRIEDGTRVFVETVAFGPGAWDVLPQALKDTFIDNALTWPDELRDPGWSTVDLDQLSRFDRPALVTDATESAPFFRPIVDTIAPSLPRARRATYTGTGHVPHATHPDIYLPLVLDFIREVHR